MKKYCSKKTRRQTYSGKVLVLYSQHNENIRKSSDVMSVRQYINGIKQSNKKELTNYYLKRLFFYGKINNRWYKQWRNGIIDPPYIQSHVKYIIELYGFNPTDIDYIAFCTPHFNRHLAFSISDYGINEKNNPYDIDWDKHKYGK
jgi:hypothetical protein